MWFLGAQLSSLALRVVADLLLVSCQSLGWGCPWKLDTSDGRYQFFPLPDGVATVLADGCWLINDPEQTGIYGVVPAWAVQTHLATSAAPLVIFECQWFRMRKDR